MFRFAALACVASALHLKSLADCDASGVVLLQLHGRVQNDEDLDDAPADAESKAEECIDVQPPLDWRSPTCEGQLQNTGNCEYRKSGAMTDGYCRKTCGVCTEEAGGVLDYKHKADEEKAEADAMERTVRRMMAKNTELPTSPGCYVYSKTGCQYTGKGPAAGQWMLDWHTGNEELRTSSAGMKVGWNESDELQSCKNREGHYNVVCNITDAHMAIVKANEEDVPITVLTNIRTVPPPQPGCYVFTPGGCDAHPILHPAREWRRDETATSQESEELCQRRRTPFNAWCNISDAQMYFVSKDATSTEQGCVDVQPPSDWSNPTCEGQLQNTSNCEIRRKVQVAGGGDGYCRKTCGVCTDEEPRGIQQLIKTWHTAGVVRQLSEAESSAAETLSKAESSAAKTFSKAESSVAESAAKAVHYVGKKVFDAVDEAAASDAAKSAARAAESYAAEIQSKTESSAAKTFSKAESSAAESAAEAVRDAEQKASDAVDEAAADEYMKLVNLRR